MTYVPAPIDTTGVDVPESLLGLVEVLAENAHDTWAALRIAEGWRYGPSRNDVDRTHPDLVRYSELPDSEKAYDRELALGTIRAVLAKGYTIQPRNSKNFRRVAIIEG